MITNCNDPFEFCLLLLYFVFLLRWSSPLPHFQFCCFASLFFEQQLSALLCRYLITNCFFCSVSYPLLPLCNSVVQLRCLAVPLRWSFMLLRCSNVLRCSVAMKPCQLNIMLTAVFAKFFSVCYLYSFTLLS